MAQVAISSVMRTTVLPFAEAKEGIVKAAQ